MFPLVIVACLSLPVAGEDPEPARCCQDRQWQGILGGIGGSLYPLTGASMAIDTYTLMTYDYNRKRIGMEVHFRHPNGTEKMMTRTLFDFASDRQYLYQDNKCTIMRIGEPMQEPCVPATAKFIGSGKLGYGTESLDINTWELIKPGTDIVVKSSFTANSCIPAMEAIYGTVNKVPINLIQVVSNYKPGIDDPASLDLPSTQGCTFVDEIGPMYGRR